MPKIERVWAYVVDDPTPDDPEDQSIPAFMDPATGFWMPLVGADIARVDSLREIAQGLATSTGKPLRLMKFDRAELVETIELGGGR